MEKHCIQTLKIALVHLHLHELAARTLDRHSPKFGWLCSWDFTIINPHLYQLEANTVVQMKQRSIMPSGCLATGLNEGQKAADCS